jgi:hypothetical protein
MAGKTCEALCDNFRYNRCLYRLIIKPDKSILDPASCESFKEKIPWLGTKHRVKKARAAGKIPNIDRDCGAWCTPINYAARGKNKNKKARR